MRSPAGRLLGLVVLAALAAVGVRLAGQPAGDDMARYHGRDFRVVHVIDGDTLDIEAPDAGSSTTRVRLWGVDTPEVAGSPQGEMHFGRQASAFTARCVAGRSVHLMLVEGKARDKYRRLVAYVYLERGGPMLNEMLIESGYGYADPRFSHPFKQRFASAEAYARKTRAGLWADVRPDQMPEWRQRLVREGSLPKR